MTPETQPQSGNSTQKMPLAYRLYGLFCILLGIYTLFAVVVFAALMTWALQTDPSMIVVGSDLTLPVVLLVISYAITFFDGIALVFFGRMLRKGSRRNAARISHVLIATSVAQVLFRLMLQGVDLSLVPDAIQLFLLIAVSVTVDPTLKEERALKRHVRDMVEREAAEEGMLGRDYEGRGYIELNFFNLFWVFVVCCILGLIIEVIYHMVVVDPGVYQDRAGMLFGPFSPIYGFGAVLMTVALNRFYRANPIIIFVVSAIIGGLFEAAVSLFMQVGFGAVAWDYTGMTLFGIPDPVAIIFQGRTATPFMIMWGGLGFVWIKLCLPWLLRLINLIPWNLRYSLTTVCAVLIVLVLASFLARRLFDDVVLGLVVVWTGIGVGVHAMEASSLAGVALIVISVLGVGLALVPWERVNVRRRSPFKEHGRHR